ncbi:DUF406 family protein [Ferrimonas senticii]|uniref:DUF406 family protein n=1 Tax=Ferrimonas senticii TaxID=394566 RepID=UPI00041A5018|nr:DUF406 family protein [Ferrimonas senticii]
MSFKHEQTASDCCGAYADIGTVISAEDNVLEVNFAAADEAAGMAEFDAYLARAQQRFAEVTGDAAWDADSAMIKGQVTFSCAAERLIFEMGA